MIPANVYTGVKLYNGDAALKSASHYVLLLSKRIPVWVKSGVKLHNGDVAVKSASNYAKSCSEAHPRLGEDGCHVELLPAADVALGMADWLKRERQAADTVQARRQYWPAASSALALADKIKQI